MASLSLAMVMAAGTAYGSGFRIPEQSINSTALANAYVAHTPGADSAFYNPANMCWLAEGWQTEAGLMYINLPAITFTKSAGASASITSGETKVENFLMPELFVVSPAYHNFRFGFALTYPAGSSKRWESTTQKGFAEDFTLKTMEINPTVSYQFRKQFSAGAGVRLLRASGEVKSFSTNPFGDFARYLVGDTLEYGYNLALSFKPTDQWSVGVTYRSEVLLGMEGDAQITAASTVAYRGNTSVDLPLPAVLTIGAAYTLGQTTVEFAYDKTYWSAYDQLDFNYDADLTLNPLTAGFDAPIAQNWSN